MATPPIVANTDFQQWQSWQPVRTPAGDRTYYVIPGYNNQYVFDPYTSDATGRITIYQNPQPLYEAEQKAQAAKEDAGSTSSQLAGIGGTIAGAGTTYLIADAIAKPWAESTLGSWLGSGSSAGTGAGAGAGATGGAGAGVTSAATQGAGQVAASQAATQAAAQSTGQVAASQAGTQAAAQAAGQTAAQSATSASTTAASPYWINPYAIAFAIGAALLNKHGEKYIGDPVISGMDKITGTKRATAVSPESFLTARDKLAEQMPWILDLPPEQQAQILLTAREANLVNMAIDKDRNVDFVQKKAAAEERYNTDPKFKAFIDRINSGEQSGDPLYGQFKQYADRVMNPGPGWAVAPAWDVKGSAFYDKDGDLITRGSQYGGGGNPEFIAFKKQRQAEDLLKYGVPAQYMGDKLDLDRMWGSLSVEQQLAINDAQREGGAPTQTMYAPTRSVWENFLTEFKPGFQGIDPAQKLQEGEGFSISRMPGETRTWDRESVNELSKDEMADMLAQLMDGRFPKAGSPQPQIVPARSSTLSPGIGKDGRRIVY